MLNIKNQKTLLSKIEIIIPHHLLIQAINSKKNIINLYHLKFLS